jgi:hypothetical protein
MTEQELFTTRPWSEADDERLRSLALKNGRRAYRKANEPSTSFCRRRASLLTILVRRSNPQKQMG